MKIKYFQIIFLLTTLMFNACSPMQEAKECKDLIVGVSEENINSQLSIDVTEFSNDSSYKDFLIVVDSFYKDGLIIVKPDEDLVSYVSSKNSYEWVKLNNKVNYLSDIDPIESATDITPGGAIYSVSLGQENFFGSKKVCIILYGKIKDSEIKVATFDELVAK